MTETAARPADPEVAILMGTYRGERFVAEQLESFRCQTHDNWSLTVSDDSDTPRTAEIIRRFARDNPGHRISLVTGPREGFVRNFLSLLAEAPNEAPFVALSDQDDVWFPDKLARAVAALKTVPPGRPAVYCGATVICDEALVPRGRSSRFRRAPRFRNALVQSIGGGNTMVLNRDGADLVARLARTSPDPVAHDWWIYQVISGFGGEVIRDPEPVLYYRQHDRNLIGANLSARDRMTRIRAVLAGRFKLWNTLNIAAIDPFAAEFTPDAQAALAWYRAARTGPWWRRIGALWRSGAIRQSRRGTVALFIACLLRRL